MEAFFLPLEVGSMQIHEFWVRKSAYSFFPVFLKPLLLEPYHIQRGQNTWSKALEWGNVSLISSYILEIVTKYVEFYIFMLL